MPSVKQLYGNHPFSSNTYLFISNGECAVIDPSAPPSELDLGVRMRYVLLTHAHFDHMLDIDAWVELGAEVIVSERDAALLHNSELNCYRPFLGVDRGYHGAYRTVRDGDVLPLGNTSLRVISCPGHTEGSVTYFSDGVAFVGDTLFDGGGFGRWDLPSGDYAKLVASIDKLISNLPDFTVLYCGHGSPTTIEKYKSDYKYRRI